MSNPLENWHPVRLSKPLIVNVSVFPEANIVAKEGEKIAVKIPAESVVYVTISGPKSGQTFIPIVSQQHAQAGSTPTTTTASSNKSPHVPHAKTNKKNLQYKPKAQLNGNAAPAGTNNNASAANGGAPANGGDAQQNGSQQQGRGKNRNNSGRNRNNAKNTNSNNKADTEKVLSADDLKRLREEQAAREAWLARRKELEKKEREEQDQRYRERLERQKKRKEEEDAKKKKEGEEKRLLNGGAPEPEEQQKEVEKESSGPKSCWICGSAAHVARKCSQRCRRSACNQEVGRYHSMNECKATCALCKRKGHDEWYCEERCPMCKRGVGDAHRLADCPVECRLCGAKGHRDKDCEYSYTNRNKGRAAPAK